MSVKPASNFAGAPCVPEQVAKPSFTRSEEHTSELQSHLNLVCRLLLEKKKKKHETQSNINARRMGQVVNSHTVLDGIITTIMATNTRINIIGSRCGSQTRSSIQPHQTV